MPRRASPHPTEAELEILNVLWRAGASTVREVHETLQADRQTTLTTTLKMLQVMTDKGLTVREDDSRPHRYAPAIPEEKTQSGLVKDLAQRAFEGSLRKLVLRAVDAGGFTDKDLDEMRKLIESRRRTQRRSK